MAVLRTAFVLSIHLIFISGYVLWGDQEEIVWPDEYHFKGEVLDLDTTIKEPFEIWYSAEQNRSRMDVYEGSTKIYYSGETGRMYKYFPKTNKDYGSQIICVKNSSKEGLVDFMPKLNNLSFTGETINLFDKLVDVWTGTEDDEKIPDILTVEKTVYVFKLVNGYNIPVQQIIKKFNKEHGSLRKHVIYNYYNFTDYVTEDDLAFNNSTCIPVKRLYRSSNVDTDMLHPDIPLDIDIAFEGYARRHNKEYLRKETHMRKAIFEKNWRMVHEHNRKNLSFKLELNEFSDQTDEELEYLSGTIVSEEVGTMLRSLSKDLTDDEDMDEVPAHFDLRMEGAVTPIKNQGQCGSCWAFATIGAMESILARTTKGRLLDLSEQSLIDCAWTYGEESLHNYGCYGGFPMFAFRHASRKGIPSEREYGVYTARDGYCHLLNMTTLYKVSDFGVVDADNPDSIKRAIYKYGPVVITVYVSDKMKYYFNGIFSEESCLDPEKRIPGRYHALIIVGYGTRDGEDYWIVKNSWGESWGEDGYMLMTTNNDANCFITFIDFIHPIV